MDTLLTPDHDAYWRSGTYETTRRSVLFLRLQAKGYIFRSGLSKNELVEVQQRLDRGLLHYEDKRITNKELLHFIDCRRLPKPTASNRKAMVSVLVGADEARVFDKFVELPPELRERIYRIHISTFPEHLFSPTQPPIARACKLLRKEALPLFHNLTSFDLRLIFRRDGYEVGDDISNGLLRPCLLTSQFLQAMNLHNAGSLRLSHLNIQVQVASMQDVLEGEGKRLFDCAYHANHATRRHRWHAHCPTGSPIMPILRRHNLQWLDHNRYKATSFSVDDIYQIRKVLEAAFFETFPEYGDWAH